MKPVGKLLGLKASHLHELDRVGRRRVPISEFATWDLLKILSSISREIRRQVGVLIDRNGDIESVIVGTNRSLDVQLPASPESSSGRLRGVRLVHTHLSGEGLSRRDFTDLEVARLDCVASVGVDEQGMPGLIHIAHISPLPNATDKVVNLPPTPYDSLHLPFDEFIQNLEAELRRTTERPIVVRKGNRAILCATHFLVKGDLEEELHETRELARTAGVQIVETVIQDRSRPDPKYMVGQGKIEEISLLATQLGVDLLLFHQNLSTSQARHISDITGLRILDRTQLILDIFAQRATSHDGKLQVELAQLKYTLPRLREYDTQMSRLVGGIGGRGPGETKLEIHRRRAKERMNRLEKEIEKVAERRATKRSLRGRSNVPIVSIVGYTNAGKSTLLNTLTHSNALAENKLFATLDPFSKRLRFPHDREIILTDTVGFIRDLPPGLLAAFRSTIEEIGEADLILHVADVGSPFCEEQIRVVREHLRNLKFDQTPEILVLNKMDLLPPDVSERLAQTMNGTPISANDASSLTMLLANIEVRLWPQNHFRLNEK